MDEMQNTSNKRNPRGKMVPSVILALSVALSGCGMRNMETGEVDVIDDQETLEAMVASFVFSTIAMYESQEIASRPTPPPAPAPAPAPPAPPPSPPPSSADSFAARTAAMSDTYTRTRYRIASGTRSPGADAPANGTAVYKGNANIRADRLSADSFAIGQAQIEADFTQNTISGRIDNFLDPSDAALAGTITLSNGSITRADRPNDAWTDDRISADLAGNLDVSGASTTVTGTMTGSFREGQIPESIIPPGRYITGNISLTTGGAQPLYGGFTVTRQ